MRGDDQESGNLFSHVDLESRVPAPHPLRVTPGTVNDVPGALSSGFEVSCFHTGRPSIPPERLLRALLLQAFCSIRPESRLMERLDFNMLFHRLVDLGPKDAVWDASTFSNDRDRLLEAEVSARSPMRAIEHRKVRRRLSRNPFSVDGTLTGAWASMKSFRPGAADADRPVGRNSERNFHGETRCNETHEGTTDPETRLYRKGNGRESRLCCMDHALIENRCRLAVHGSVTQATGMDEREAVPGLADRRSGRSRRRIASGADKACDVSAFVGDLRARKVTPHISMNAHLTRTAKRRGTAIDGRTTCHAGDAASQRCRKRIEEVFGCARIRCGQARTGLSRLAMSGGLLYARRLHPDPVAQAAGWRSAMTRDVACPRVGKGRIVAADPRDRKPLDFLGTAHIAFSGDGSAELEHDGAPDTRFRHRLGDAAILKAHG